MSIRFHNVSKAYTPKQPVLKVPELAIDDGSLVAVLGPSGCGKSTLLRLIASLETPTAGTLTLDGRPADEAPADLAVVFQDATLLPWLNVERNIALPLQLRGRPRKERLRIAVERARQVGLGDAIHLYPNQLSGGMKMRVSLARALAPSPRLLLLDEPFGALDEITRHRLNEDLSTLHHDNSRTTLFVTHSITEAAFLADRILVLSPAPGKIVADVANSAPHPRTAEFREAPAYQSLTAQLSRMIREHA